MTLSLNAKQRSGLRSLLIAAATNVMMACASDLDDFAHVTHSESFLRPTDPSAGLPRLDPADIVETVESSAFKVHYSVDGPNSIPLTDADGTGKPDFAELVLKTCDEALAYYTEELNFRRPISDGFLTEANGGDDRFDIYLVDFARRGDGQYRIDGCLNDAPEKCTGHMLLENDFAGYGYPSIETAIRIVGSHELFHAIQAAYAADQDVVVSEATAVWATERFDPSLNDFEAFIGTYLARADRSLFIAPAGIADGYPYSVALLFRFLEESLGPEVVLHLWESIEQDPFNSDWLLALDRVLALHYATSFPSAFEQFALWNVYTGDRALPSYAYQEGSRYPQVKAETVSLPHRAEQPRLFAASTRYWVFEPGTRATVTASLAAPIGSAATDGVSIWMVPVGLAGAEEPVEVTDDTLLSTTDLQSVVLAAINTNASGASKRPTVCIGSPPETAACVANESTDGGVSDPDPDSGAVDSDSPDLDESKGCSSARVSRQPPWWGLLVLTIAIFHAFRRQRQSSSMIQSCPRLSDAGSERRGPGYGLRP